MASEICKNCGHEKVWHFDFMAEDYSPAQRGCSPDDGGECFCSGFEPADQPDPQSLIALPVRYTEQTKELGYGSWRDANGTYLFQDSGTDDNSFLLHKERNDYVATAINNAPKLGIAVEALKSWKCHHCHGNGKSRELLIDVCTQCKGTGLNSIASDALAKVKGETK